jgi:hypothetical protein
MAVVSKIEQQKRVSCLSLESHHKMPSTQSQLLELWPLFQRFAIHNTVDVTRLHELVTSRTRCAPAKEKRKRDALDDPYLVASLEA